MPATRLKNASLVTPEGVVRADMVLRDGRIVLPDDSAACDQAIDLAGKYVVPGFVDNHFHGFNLFEFTLGRYDPATETFDASEAAYRQGFDMLQQRLCRYGVTAFYVGSWAAPFETLDRCFGYLGDHLARSSGTISGARLRGAFLEGSFLNPRLCGAMNPEYVLEHSRESFDRIQSRGTIRLANVVPDYGRRSCDLIEYLTGKGIVVGAGHVDATRVQWADAIKAGLKYAVHFTNGPTGGSTKVFDGGGSIEAVLSFDEIYAELILDGYHVNPAYVRDIMRRKGLDRIIGISDAMHLSGSGITGEFSLGGIRGKVSENGEYFAVVGKKNALFSANITMDRVFANILNWLSRPLPGIWTREHDALLFEDAVAAAARICSTNPCNLTGLSREGYGALTAGAPADLVVLSIGGNEGSYSVAVDRTIVGGTTVYCAADR